MVRSRLSVRILQVRHLLRASVSILPADFVLWPRGGPFLALMVPLMLHD